MSRVEELVASVFKANGLRAEIGREIHRSVVSEMAEGYLECKKCRRRESLDVVQVNTYLDHGWPLCCGMTMALEGFAPNRVTIAPVPHVCDCCTEGSHDDCANVVASSAADKLCDCTHGDSPCPLPGRSA